MKIDELTANDKNMDFKLLNIDKDVMDEVMSHWKFENHGQAMEAGILLLQTFASADKQGCNMAYFSTEVDGKKAFYAFNYLGMIELLKDPARPAGSTHKVKMIAKE